MRRTHPPRPEEQHVMDIDTRVDFAEATQSCDRRIDEHTGYH